MCDNGPCHMGDAAQTKLGGRHLKQNLDAVEWSNHTFGDHTRHSTCQDVADFSRKTMEVLVMNGC